MTYCKICNNKKDCMQNHWVTTMDRNRRLASTGEWLCDNFVTDENVIILYNKLQKEMK